VERTGRAALANHQALVFAQPRTLPAARALVHADRGAKAIAPEMGLPLNDGRVLDALSPHPNLQKNARMLSTCTRAKVRAGEHGMPETKRW